MLTQEVNLGKATFSSHNTAIKVDLSASICIEYDASLSVRVAAAFANAFDPRELLLLQGQSLPFLIVLSFDPVLNITTADLESHIIVIEKAFSDYSVSARLKSMLPSDTGRCGSSLNLCLDVLLDATSLTIAKMYHPTPSLSSFDALAVIPSSTRGLIISMKPRGGVVVRDSSSFFEPG